MGDAPLKDKPMMRVVKIVLPLLVVAAGVGAFIWLSVTAEPLEPLRPTARAPVVSVQVVEKTAASPTLAIFGRVEAPTTSVLTAGVEADIIEVAVLEGDSVRAGQTMIMLDDIDATLEMQQRQAELTEIEALLESDAIQLEADKLALNAEQELLALRHKAVARAERLARSKAGSEAALDQALQDEERQRLAVIQRRRAIDDFPARQRQLQARRDNAEAALKRAQRERERTRVTAPFNGRIADVMVSAGDRTTPGSRLIQLYDESQLELRAQVPSGYIAALQRALDDGLPVNAVSVNTAAAANSEPIEFVLHRLSAQVGEGRGGIDAFFRAQRGRLPVPGGTLEINLILPPIENVVLLAPDALYGRGRIYRVGDDNRLESLPVRRLGQLSDAQGRQMLIVDGDAFNPGDQVLNSRLPQAINGLEVRVARQ